MPPCDTLDKDPIIGGHSITSPDPCIVKVALHLRLDRGITLLSTLRVLVVWAESKKNLEAFRLETPLRGGLGLMNLTDDCHTSRRPETSSRSAG